MAPQDGLHSIFEMQQHAFAEHMPLTCGQRITALNTLLSGILKYKAIFIEALSHDFGHRSAYETELLEISALVGEIRYVKRHLRHWMRPRAVPVNWQFLPSRGRIVYQPLGVVGVIGAWNYPLVLTLSPLINALAAGNHVMLKPAERAPATAKAIADMLAECFPAEYVTVVTGDATVSAAFSALPFNHLIFTGSAQIGKQVMAAAAQNLTPVTLELGGKSPALVHESYPMAIAADRIISAKLWNAGQTCIAPDYALVPVQQIDAFVQHAKASIKKRLPSLVANDDYTHMISSNAWLRMQSLVVDARSNGAQIVQVNPANEACTADNQVFPPILIIGAKDTMQIMQQEIFGPVLPIVGYESLDDAIAIINAGQHPLALYYFDHNRSRIELLLQRTTSGGVAINDCIFHMPQHNLPFGGVGNSGMGAYGGFHGFETFSKKKGVLLQSRWTGALLARLTKPPYGAWSNRLIAFLTGKHKENEIKRVDFFDKK